MLVMRAVQLSVAVLRMLWKLQVTKGQREYYVNDAGNQMRVFYDTLYSRYMQASGRDEPLPDPAYPGEYLNELAQIC
ncbi:MAG: hypothetical protein Ct9H300mP19_19760 [Dehalococcoidia bacterium]|nr:MAG: hypothetical protein Ct9H300mP19_19760 [Dehalococcoidia bacterium]